MVHDEYVGYAAPAEGQLRRVADPFRVRKELELLCAQLCEDCIGGRGLGKTELSVSDNLSLGVESVIVRCREANDNTPRCERRCHAVVEDIILQRKRRA